MGMKLHWGSGGRNRSRVGTVAMKHGKRVYLRRGG